VTWGIPRVYMLPPRPGNAPCPFRAIAYLGMLMKLVWVKTLPHACAFGAGEVSVSYLQVIGRLSV